MSSSNSIKKNVFFNMLFQVLVIIAPIITTPYVQRTIGTDGVGIYSFTNSVVMYFSMCTALGTVAYGTREIARNRDNRDAYSKLFFEIEFLTVLTSVVCLLVWGAFVLVTDTYRTIYIILTLNILATVFDISWFYAGLEKFKYTVTQNAIFKILGIIAVFMFVKTKNDTPKYVLIMSLTTLLGNISMWSYLPKFINRQSFRTLRIFHHFRETLIYFIPTVAISIYTVLDKTLIGLITHSEFENGYYEQATKIISMVKSLTFYSINVVVGARIAYLFAENKTAEIKQRIHDSMDVIFLIGYGAVFGLTGVADRFILIYLGKDCEDVVQLVYWMCPLVIIVGISNCLGHQYYTPAGLRIKSSKYIIAGSVVNLICNLLLIPKFGAVGAVIGSIVAEGTISALYLGNCDRNLVLKDLCSMSVKRIIAGLMMWGIIVFLGRLLVNNSIWNLIILVVVGVCSYGVLLCALKDQLTLRVLKRVIGKMRSH